jgi:SAM-dependent methyltransferase
MHGSSLAEAGQQLRQILQLYANEELARRTPAKASPGAPASQPTPRRRSTFLYPGIEVGDDDVVLDVGCGRGDICVKAGTIGAAVIAIDMLESTLRFVEKRMATVPAKWFRGYVSDCMPAPLPDGAATVVVAQEVLEHTENPEGFLRELVRLGAPQARYLITVPDAASENLLRIVAPPEYFAPPNHRNVFTRQDMERMLGASGLRIVQRGVVGFYWSLWWLFEMAGRKAMQGKQDALPNAPVKKWEETWAALQACPESERISRALDELCPKSMVFTCCKARI